MFLTTTLYFIHAYACLHVRAHTRKRINNIVLIFQDRKEIRIQLEKYYPENISIKEEYYYSKKNIIEEKGETQKNILPIKKKYSTFAHVLTDNKINYIYFKTFK